MSATKTILAGDIGGTKTRLAVFSTEQGPRQALYDSTFPSGNYTSLESIIHAFLAGKGLTVDGASIGIAGPIVANRVQVTNLPWVIDGRDVSRELGGVNVDLLNDMEAIGHGVPFLHGDELETLNEGTAAQHGSLSICAPGTGLGEGYLTWTGKRYWPFPSEGGHADFAPSSPLQVELLNYLWPRFSHVSFERVCSGLGIPNLYAFCKDRAQTPEPAWLHDQLAAAEDKTPVIVQAAQQNKSEICRQALELFVSILGSEAGNQALKVLATGGVYLGGGIPPRIAAQLREMNFMKAFTNKGRMGRLLANMPVHIIRKADAGLFGAACHGLAED